ncbi:aldehyde dehydrogenase family protein [Porphyrobacter sp. TH134]|uniref:aldehyde dehydrogenase family protein n=1 Tax=Porphyrobacter sp. TH134 TaxID=2067450 RepID=UPI000C7C0961|nr:aldehyde dehydrogenase family protein [Porphyrobacter sp. TH134]PLK22818.1 aldehyde dehydrogenase family protein [Porphyrobacter sp. TH134]
MPLPDATRHFIGGAWVAPLSDARAPITDPATEETVGEVALGNAADVERAVAAARSAFPGFAATPLEERRAMIARVLALLEERSAAIGEAIAAEMGAPAALACGAQAGSGPQHFRAILRVLDDFRFEEALGRTLLRKEPIGVCALITPWNWPMNQIATKVAPALAAGCTMVLKPSEVAPLDAALLAEILDEAGVPPGVFNLVQGDGPGVGAALCAHPDIDMVSFTGSTRAGIAISEAAAATVKRVALELGGKSAAILLEDADFARAVPAVVAGVMLNSGQSCNATARLLVPDDRHEEAAELARVAAERMAPGREGGIGPLANAAQFARVRDMIRGALAEGARLVTGGPERPAGLTRGYYVAPTVFADVTPDMTIAREEIFGPVVTIHRYRDEYDAVRIANDSPYGLSGAVWSGDHARAVAVAARLRTGMVHINGAGLDSMAPFGGYKMSGNGREWGRHGLEEFLEVKSVYGGCPA